MATVTDPENAVKIYVKHQLFLSTDKFDYDDVEFRTKWKQRVIVIKQDELIDVLADKVIGTRATKEQLEDYRKNRSKYQNTSFTDEQGKDETSKKDGGKSDKNEISQTDDNDQNSQGSQGSGQSGLQSIVTIVPFPTQANSPTGRKKDQDTGGKENENANTEMKEVEPSQHPTITETEDEGTGKTETEGNGQGDEGTGKQDENGNGKETDDQEDDDQGSQVSNPNANEKKKENEEDKRKIELLRKRKEYLLQMSQFVDEQGDTIDDRIKRGHEMASKEWLWENPLFYQGKLYRANLSDMYTYNQILALIANDSVVTKDKGRQLWTLSPDDSKDVLILIGIRYTTLQTLSYRSFIGDLHAQRERDKLARLQKEKIHKQKKRESKSQLRSILKDGRSRIEKGARDLSQHVTFQDQMNEQQEQAMGLNVDSLLNRMQPTMDSTITDQVHASKLGQSRYSTGTQPEVIGTSIITGETLEPQSNLTNLQLLQQQNENQMQNQDTEMMSSIHVTGLKENRQAQMNISFLGQQDLYQSHLKNVSSRTSTTTSRTGTTSTAVTTNKASPTTTPQTTTPTSTATTTGKRTQTQTRLTKDGVPPRKRRRADIGTNGDDTTHRREEKEDELDLIEGLSPISNRSAKSMHSATDTLELLLYSFDKGNQTEQQNAKQQMSSLRDKLFKDFQKQQQQYLQRIDDMIAQRESATRGRTTTRHPTQTTTTTTGPTLPPVTQLTRPKPTVTGEDTDVQITTMGSGGSPSDKGSSDKDGSKGSGTPFGAPPRFPGGPGQPGKPGKPGGGGNGNGNGNGGNGNGNGNGNGSKSGSIGSDAHHPIINNLINIVSQQQQQIGQVIDTLNKSSGNTTRKFTNEYDKHFDKMKAQKDLDYTVKPFSGEGQSKAVIQQNFVFWLYSTIKHVEQCRVKKKHEPFFVEKIAQKGLIRKAKQLYNNHVFRSGKFKTFDELIYFLFTYFPLEDVIKYYFAAVHKVTLNHRSAYETMLQPYIHAFGIYKMVAGYTAKPIMASYMIGDSKVAIVAFKKLPSKLQERIKNHCDIRGEILPSTLELLQAKLNIFAAQDRDLQYNSHNPYSGTSNPQSANIDIGKQVNLTQSQKNGKKNGKNRGNKTKKPGKGGNKKPGKNGNKKNGKKFGKKKNGNGKDKRGKNGNKSFKTKNKPQGKKSKTGLPFHPITNPTIPSYASDLSKVDFFYFNGICYKCTEPGHRSRHCDDKLMTGMIKKECKNRFNNNKNTRNQYQSVSAMQQMPMQYQPSQFGNIPQMNPGNFNVNSITNSQQNMQMNHNLNNLNNIRSNMNSNSNLNNSVNTFNSNVGSMNANMASNNNGMNLSQNVNALQGISGNSVNQVNSSVRSTSNLQRLVNTVQTGSKSAESVSIQDSNRAATVDPNEVRNTAPVDHAQRNLQDSHYFNPTQRQVYISDSNNTSNPTVTIDNQSMQQQQ